MATDSIRKQVLDNLQSVLATISTASGDANNITSAQVFNWHRPIDQVSSAEMPMLMVVPGPETIARQKAAKVDVSSWEVSIIGYVHSADPSAIRTQIESLMRDVRKKVMSDPRRGGIVIRTIVRSVEDDEGQLAYLGFGAFSVNLEIEYEYSWSSP